jgi:type I restriction enzyme R subunit
MIMSYGPEYKLAEKPILEYLKTLNYQYLHPKDHDTVRDGENSVILRSELIPAIKKINNLDEDTATAAYQDILKLADNQTWLRYLRGDYSRTVQGEQNKKTIKLIDFQKPENNTFTVTNQLYIKAQKSRIPDIIVLINGIPLVVIEAKSPVSGKDKTGEAFDQIKQYERDIPRLFYSNAFNIVTDGKQLLYGATGASSKYWGVWKDPWPKALQEFDNDPLKWSLYSLLEPTRLLDLIAHFIVFETNKETGKTIKKLCRYHQFRAVNKVFDRVLSNEHSKGLIWHTQGSGKSLTMVYSVLKLKTHLTTAEDRIHNPNIMVLTDRIDLDDQISKTFEACGLRNPVQIESVKDLHQMIKSGSAGLTLLSTIFKFQGSKAPVKDSGNWILLVDECHRTQEKDLGAFLRATFPEAKFFGFTGTPIKTSDKDTYENFGAVGEGYLDKYSIDDAVADGATVPIHYTNRMTEWHIDPKKLDVLFDNWFAGEPEEVIERIKKRGVTLSELAKHTKRVDLIAFDMWTHFKEYAMPDGLKAQVVGIDREAVVMYKNALDKVIAADLQKSEKLTAKVAFDKATLMSVCVYSKNQEDDKDSEDLQTDALRKDLRKLFIDEDRLKSEIVPAFGKSGQAPYFLIVCNKLLTGFDAPIEGVMYLDNPLTEHNLLQAIARTNRQWGEGLKQNGLIVDYIGISRRLDEALSSYRQDDVKNAMRDLDVLAGQLEAAHREVKDMIKGVKINYKQLRDSFIALSQKIGTIDVWTIFKKKAKAFITAYSALSPDPRVLNYQEDLKWIMQFMVWGCQEFEKKESFDHRDYSLKIRQMLEEQLDVTGLRTVCKLKKITDPDFWEDFKPDQKPEDVRRAAIRKATELKKTTSERVEDNKLRYGPFSERVLEAIKRFEEGQMGAAELLNDLEKVARDIVDEDNAYEKSGLSPKGYDIYKILEAFRNIVESTDRENANKKSKDDNEELKVINTLKDLARNIESLYSSDDTAPRGWHLKEEMKKNIRQQVRRLIHPANLRSWKDVPTRVEEYALKSFIKV